MIELIEVHNYKKPLGGNQGLHEFYKGQIIDIITKNIEVDTKQLDIYKLNREYQNYKVGRKDRIVIFINATFEGAVEEELILEAPMKINGIENDFTQFLTPKYGDNNIIITSENGIPLAEWSEELYELNILFDLFPKEDEVNTVNRDNQLKIFEFIIKEFNRLVWKVKKLENSWIYTSNKDKLLESLNKSIVEQKQEQIQSEKLKLANYKRAIEERRRELKTYIEAHDRLMRTISNEEEYVGKVIENLINDLDLISKHEKIKDIKIIDDMFEIETNHLNIFTEQGEEYNGGEYKIKIRMDRVSVLFEGNNRRKSFWTTQDPHPHVNGETGEACFGNLSTTIAELCSQSQLYALVLVCIDFLESVNTEDPAGKNVINWDRIVDGEIIEASEIKKEWCSECGELYEENELYVVYDNVIEDEEGEIIEVDEDYMCRVCPICLEQHYHYNESVGDYVRNGCDD